MNHSKSDHDILCVINTCASLSKMMGCQVRVRDIVERLSGFNVNISYSELESYIRGCGYDINTIDGTEYLIVN